MKVLDVVIIEDEDLAASSLENLLLKSPYSISVKKRLESVEDSIVWLQNNTCDLILSDIHLGDGYSFEIFEKLKTSTPIIFTTAFDEYAIKSFQFFAIDYLLKPYSEEALQKAIEKYVGLNEDKGYSDKLEQLLLQMSSKINDQKEKERFLVSKGNLSISIKREDVAYFMAQGKYLFLFTFDNESYLYDGTISSLEEELSEKYFFKINRKYIIQHSAIKNISKYSNNRIKIDLQSDLNVEEILLVSAQRIKDFKNWLDN
ncbi:LytTR family two component transcriptional regulator [Tenacibaculum lutimaris]|uniref:LytTR family two component transcriptional regulator n=1 Tax=Tenacibaculum lutimaris TaxID=285258 RepID=A0A420E3Q0_9FLAO|nr:LytTR family DNA-binding domain-containing protein [Tenacibaculum lutimaris]RKF04659.1 LytTR family two component transcriptional regulator [Tenacibaculum lutimaris]